MKREGVKIRKGLIFLVDVKANFQPTTQPAKDDVLCVLRVVWQSPRSCKLRSRQRSRVPLVVRNADIESSG